MIILIDNYDSFTYNLYQYIGEIDNNIEVYRNDMITSAKIKELNPTHIVISPGPGHPADAGNCLEIIKDNMTSKDEKITLEDSIKQIS